MDQTQCPTDERLTDFLNGTLSETESNDINTHLTACIQCQAKLDAQTESHLVTGFNFDEPASDPAVSALVSRLSVLSPSIMTDDASVTSSAIRFPGEPTDDAPLGELGAYKIKEQIGDGSSGLLYRAVDPRIDREVAIKVLRSELASQDESRQRLNREARAVAGLVHPNVVQLHEFGNAAGFPPYLVMEMVQGESLSERIKRGEPFSAREAIEIVVPIARALATAHDQNLIHRDVKPSNILLDENGKPKITDFGLALLDDGNTELTRQGSLAGTPAFISPEQILDPHHVDGRSDTYSLGVVLYQMLTGELPFKGVVRMTLLAVMHKEPPPPRQFNDEIPRDIETIALKAMSKDPAKRYQTASDFADDLEDWRDGKPITARPVGRIERLVRWCKRNPGIASLSAAVACLLLTVTVGSVIASINLASARSEAQDAARIAKNQRDQAFSTLNRLVYEVNEQFEDDTTSVDEIQQTVLDMCVRGLSDIANQADGEGLTDVSTAAAHLRLGMVLSRLSRYDEADEHLDKGDEILTSLGGEKSDDWQVVGHMIEALGFRSTHALYQEDFGQSTKQLEEAVALAKRAFDRWPDNYQIHLAIAMSQSNLADRNYTLDLDGTVELAESALATWQELEQAYPDDQLIGREMTNTIDTLAVSYFDAEETDKAIKLYDRLINRCDAALATDPEAPDYADWLILAHHVLADIQKEQGEKQKAIDHLVLAMEAEDKFEHWVDFEVIQSIQRDLDELRDEDR
ncbi:MAG: protein kinase [Planctomycetaceae bacterium]